GSNSTQTLARYATPDFSKMNIWRKPGDQAEYPAYPLGAYRYYTVASQSYYLDDGGYLRIRSVSLAYNLSQQLMRKWGMNNVKIYGVMDNVAMFQKSKRLPDAEGVNFHGEYAGGGYPIPKKFTLGI